MNANRTRWNLKPVDDVLGYILGDKPWLASDPTLGPAPFTPGLQVLQTGAWIMEDDSELSPELERFLNDASCSEEPPIYFGFGSMPVAQDIAEVLRAAARRLGRRSIISRGWSELDPIEDSEDCIVVDEVNQQALFPRVAVVVHHGGAGTMTAAARAAVPQVAVPMFGDQFYWGQRLQDLCIGVSVPMAALTQDTLVDALRLALSSNVASCAQSLGKRVVTNGAAVAAQRLAEGVSNFRR